ncbi:hypothetical protein [Sphingobium nicotianae]|uniref:DUF8021 domain-containing protein n=1 Tax=Sphingobium nicotianae TaxID=2782607 RepID=A0A9X1IS55_9SPHN|nr:hypothetical protein [Sphingobium nicotianae]MBT2188191.1 hypothetical protein [Sphingobium nicotianae]
MMSRMRSALLAGLCLAAAPFALAAPARSAGNPTDKVLDVDCDRACLQAALENVLAAIAAKDITNLPLGNDVRSTQNGVEIRLDDGIWQTVSAIGKYRLFAIDPVSGQAGVYTTMTQGAKQLLVAVRIGTWEQKIHEIEFVIAAGAGGPGGSSPGDGVEKQGRPRPQFLRTVPAKERMSRADLIRTANSYFSTLAGSTGKYIAPFAPTCHRLENGFATTNNKSNVRLGEANRNGPNMIAMGCEEQWKTGFFRFVTGIRDRRFPIVDEERGIVMAFGFFDHSGTIREMKLGTGETIEATLKNPATWLISEAFQINKGKLDQIEAVLEAVPYKMRNAVWTEGDHIP